MSVGATLRNPCGFGLVTTRRWNRLSSEWAALTALSFLALLTVSHAARNPLGPCLTVFQNITLVSPTDLFFTYYANVMLPQYNLPSLMAEVVVVPQTVRDVQTVLQCAMANHIPLSVKGGGHNYAGYSQAPSSGFMMTLQEMSDVVFVWYRGWIPAVRFGGGVTFSTIYEYLNKSFPQYVLAGGFCPSVGATAFHLGGGLGALCREYGMGVDNVLEAEVVTADGSRVIVANESENSLLFWALRGGGGPSFGVVTHLTVKLHPAVPKYSYGEFCSGRSSMDVQTELLRLSNYTNTKDFPNWLTVDWRLVKRKDTVHSGLCYLVYSLRGVNETRAALTPLVNDSTLWGSRDVGPKLGDPFWNFLEEFPDYYDMELANAAYKGYLFTPLALPSKNTNCILPAMNPGLVAALMGLYNAMPNASMGGPSCYVQGMALGGTFLSSIAPNATAFPFRDAICYAADSECDFSSTDEQLATEAFVGSYVPAVTPWCQGAFLNFPYPGLNASYPKAYWRSNVQQLQMARSIYNNYTWYPQTFAQEVPLP